MIDIIGVQKIFLIILLMTASIVFIFSKYVVLLPKQTVVERAISLNKSEISDSRTKIDQLIRNHSRFEEQKERFDYIEQTDFFNKQGRLDARLLINQINAQSRVVSSRFSISPVKVEYNESAQEVLHKLINTGIEFNIGAIEDTDIYNFLFLVLHGFPGIVELQEFSIERSTAITQPLLRKIGSGDLEPIVTARIKIVWRTLVPSNTVDAEGTLTEGGE